MRTEIADPEHRQLGTFDWVFVLTYLMPLFLLALVFDLGGAERDRGSLSLIRLHAGGVQQWLAWRFVVPMIAVWIATLAPMLVVAQQAGAFAEQLRALLAIIALATAYLLFWAAVLLLAARMASSSNDQALRGGIAYAAICLVIPGAVQWGAKLQHPPSLMVDYITAHRVGAQAVYELDADTIQRRFYAARPDLRNTPYGRDTVPNENIDWMMGSTLVALMMDSVVQEVAQGDRERIEAIERASWWLPCMSIPLLMEEAAGTSAAHHLAFRISVQDGGKRILNGIINDSWNKRVMDAEGFRNYAGL
jgi:ABC-2 type transport system permease protein